MMRMLKTSTTKSVNLATSCSRASYAGAGSRSLRISHKAALSDYDSTCKDRASPLVIQVYTIHNNNELEYVKYRFSLEKESVRFVRVYGKRGELWTRY